MTLTSSLLKAKEEYANDMEPGFLADVLLRKDNVLYLKLFKSGVKKQLFSVHMQQETLQDKEAATLYHVGGLGQIRAKCSGN